LLGEIGNLGDLSKNRGLTPTARLSEIVWFVHLLASFATKL
jgi:hypothetical protein